MHIGLAIFSSSHNEKALTRAVSGNSWLSLFNHGGDDSESSSHMVCFHCIGLGPESTQQTFP